MAAGCSERNTPEKTSSTCGAYHPLTKPERRSRGVVLPVQLGAEVVVNEEVVVVKVEAQRIEEVGIIGLVAKEFVSLIGIYRYQC